MKTGNFGYGTAGIHFQDVEVAETVCLLKLHSAFHTVSRDQGYGNDIVVPDIHQTVSGKNSHSFRVRKGAFCAVFPDIFHIAVLDSIVEGILILHGTVCLIQFMLVEFSAVPFMA